MHFVPFPGSSSSGGQVLGKCTVPGGPCVLITSPVLASWCPRCAARAPSQVCHVGGVSPLGSCSQAATLLADVNRPGSQEDMVSKWEPARSLVEDAGPWGRDCSSPLPCSSGCRTPASLPLGTGGLPSSSLVLAQSFVLCAGQAVC